MRQESYKADKLARRSVSAAALVRQPEDADQILHAGISDEDEFKKSNDKPVNLIASSHDAEGGKKSGNTCTDTGSIADLAYLAKQRLFKGHYNKLFIELCCESDSVLSEKVCGRALAIRITKEDDMSHKNTAKALHGIIRTARHLGIEVHTWVSIPCTAGCPVRRVTLSSPRNLSMWQKAWSSTPLRQVARCTGNGQRPHHSGQSMALMSSSPPQAAKKSMGPLQQLA